MLSLDVRVLQKNAVSLLLLVASGAVSATYLTDVSNVILDARSYPFPCESCGWHYRSPETYLVSGLFIFSPVLAVVLMLVRQWGQWIGSVKAVTVLTLSVVTSVSLSETSESLGWLLLFVVAGASAGILRFRLLRVILALFASALSAIALVAL